MTDSKLRIRRAAAGLATALALMLLAARPGPPMRFPAGLPHRPGSAGRHGAGRGVRRVSDPNKDAAIFIAALPAAAYSEIEKPMDTEALGRQAH